MSNKIENGQYRQEVFCTSRRHPKTGKIIYAKPGKVFHFWINVKKTA